MPLDPAAEKRIRAEAAKRGQDPDAAVARAEKSGAKPSGNDAPAKPDAGGKPVADRLLIGFLPFIKVRELRAEWLGLTERIDDDEMTCGDFAAKHGGTAAPTAAEPAP